MRTAYLAAFIGSVLLTSNVCLAQEDLKHTVVSKSPNEKLYALIKPVFHRKGDSPEFRLGVYESNKKLIAQKDFSSADGTHGKVISHYVWTPDSRFFVFTTSSSGGHAPWHFPAFFFDPNKKQFFSLDDLVKPVVDPTIKVGAPDIVQMKFQRRDGSEEGEWKKVSLSQLGKK